MKTQVLSAAIMASLAAVAVSEVVLAATTSAVTLSASYTAMAAIAALKILAYKIAALAFAGRRKRDASSEVEVAFSSIASIDSYGCGLRLVCELEQKAEEELLEDERLILSLFGLHPTLPAYLKFDSAKSQYDFAAWLGASKAKTCKELYNKCPLNAEQMLQEFRVASGAAQQ